MLSGLSMFKPDHTCTQCSFLNTFIVVVLLIHQSFGQNLAVPDDKLSRMISRNYLPLQTASPQIECGVNMFLEESDDGQEYCECLSGYIYHSETDGCYTLYTRGPCENGHHFIVQPGTMIAGCEPNPCGPGRFLLMSAITHQLVCMPDVLPKPFIIDVPMPRCPPGTQPAGQGMCREKT